MRFPDSVSSSDEVDDEEVDAASSLLSLSSDSESSLEPVQDDNALIQCHEL
jgi:hypothetical protein